MDAIKNSKALRGNRGDDTKGKITTDLSQRGRLYMVTKNSEALWNGISSSMIFETIECVTDYMSRVGKPYWVVKINEDSFTKRGLSVAEDESSGGELISQYCREVILGDKEIPLKEIEVIGEFQTKPNKWHKIDKWNIARAIKE